MTALAIDQVAHAIEHLAQATRLLAQTKATPVDNVSLATEHLVQVTWILVVVTALLALASSAAVVVPVVIHRLDCRRADEAALRQLATILNIFVGRMQDIVESPYVSVVASPAGLDSLFQRALQSDISRAVKPERLSRILSAISNASQVLMDSLSIQERTTKRGREAEDRTLNLRMKIGDLESGVASAGGNPNIVYGLQTQITEIRAEIAKQAEETDRDFEFQMKQIVAEAKRAKEQLLKAF